MQSNFTLQPTLLVDSAHHRSKFSALSKQSANISPKSGGYVFLSRRVVNNVYVYIKLPKTNHLTRIINLKYSTDVSNSIILFTKYHLLFIS